MTSPSPLPAPDSYIGSFLSVTSKSEIRYEGFLYYLNPEDSTLGLKDVRSYGTEGRKKDGQQVPPLDQVYDYILFRGSDIKDLQVKGAPPVKIEEPIFSDPAIIQSNVGPSSSSRSVPATCGSLAEFNLYGEPSALNARSYPSILPSHHSGTQLGIWGSSESKHSAAPSFGLPTQCQGYSGAPGSTPGAQQHSLSSPTMLYPMQNQAPTTMPMINLCNNVFPGHSLATPSSIYLNATPSLTSEQLSTPFTDSLPSKPSLPFHHSTLINSHGLTMPYSLPCHNTSSIEAQVVNKDVPDPVSSLPVQSSPYSTSLVSDSISDPLLRQQKVLLTPNLSKPTVPERSPAKKLYLDLKVDLKDMGATSSISLNHSSATTSTAVRSPLLPLPPPSQKLQNTDQFSEEFDFQAMNEKFNKDEVWEYLGKVNQRDKVEGTQDNRTRSQDFDLASTSNPKLAYNKDDFFDTFSYNSVGRGSTNGQSRLSERVKLDSETFGNFQRRTQFGYGGHRAGHGGHRGPYNYNYGNRGRGGRKQR